MYTILSKVRAHLLSDTHTNEWERKKKLEMCLAIKRYAAAAVTAKQEWKFFPFTFQYHPFYIAMAEWEERHHRNVKFSLSLYTMFNIMDRWCEVESESEGECEAGQMKKIKKINIHKKLRR